MKVVILCGGLGTRIRDVTEAIPKPMVPVGPHPILRHIMRYYAGFGFKEFVLCLGYKKDVIIDFFLNYRAHNCDLTVQLGRNSEVIYHAPAQEMDDWRITLADTGIATNTGGRVKRIARYLDDGPFMLTYGDGVCDLDLHALLACHKKSGQLATITAVHPAGRFGEIEINGNHVKSFHEKPQTAQGYINGGFMVIERKFIERYISDEPSVSLETHALTTAAAEGQLNAYRHDGFWQCMDTARDHQYLNDLWDRGHAPWVEKRS